MDAENYYNANYYSVNYYNRDRNLRSHYNLTTSKSGLNTDDIFIFVREIKSYINFYSLRYLYLLGYPYKKYW